MLYLGHILVLAEGRHSKNINFDKKGLRFRLYGRCKYPAFFIPAQVARLRPREAGARPQRLRQDSAKAGRGGHRKGEMRRKLDKYLFF